YSFHWFLLAEEEVVPHWHEPTPEPLPELVTLVMRDGWKSVATGREADALFRYALPNFLPKQRWFAAKGTSIAGVDRGNCAILHSSVGDYLLIDLEVRLSDGAKQRYFVPLAYVGDEQALSPSAPLLPFTVARGRRFRTVGPIYDAVLNERFPLALIEAMRGNVELAASDGVIRFSGSDELQEIELPPDAAVRRIGVEQSNSSVIVGDKSVLKLYRRVIEGPHPELEMSRVLSRAGYTNTPPFLGAIEHVAADGRTTALGILHGFLFNQGDGWAYTLDYLDRMLEDRALQQTEVPGTEELYPVYLVQAATLGRRTAELHRALSIETDDPAFRQEPIQPEDMKAWRRSIRAQAEITLRILESRMASLPDEPREQAE